MDALQLTLFSRDASGATLDATSLLARRSCYAGEYELGIPLSAYDSGKILATWKDYWIVRLANRDILVIPACDR